MECGNLCQSPGKETFFFKTFVLKSPEVCGDCPRDICKGGASPTHQERPGWKSCNWNHYYYIAKGLLCPDRTLKWNFGTTKNSERGFLNFMPLKAQDKQGILEFLKKKSPGRYTSPILRDCVNFSYLAPWRGSWACCWFRAPGPNEQCSSLSPTLGRNTQSTPECSD